MTKTGFLPWWRGRSVREQRMLLAGGLLALAVLIWLLVVRPLGDALADARERHNDAVTALSDVRADVAARKSAQGKAAPAVTGPVDALVSRAAGEAGFPITRLDRHSASRVTLALEAVRPPAFFAWLGRMEAQHGLVVERLSATTNSDQTLAIQVTLQGRAG